MNKNESKMAGNLELTTFHPGFIRSSAKYMRVLANPSFSHKSSHHFMVAIFPNHCKNKVDQLSTHIIQWYKSDNNDCDSYFLKPNNQGVGEFECVITFFDVG